jgi:Icc-related predicted phosphoesterase
MKIVALSDTHGQHRMVSVPDGDILIFSGDMTMGGEPWALNDFSEWLAALPHEHKLWTYGNHEWTCDPRNAHYVPGFDCIVQSGRRLGDHQSGTLVKVNGLRIWGSPVHPRFHGWAFGREKGSDIRRYWEQIPLDADVVVTHGPPQGILDANGAGEQCGCPALRDRLSAVRPAVHIFGHIHTRYGVEQRGATRFVNAALLDDKYELVREPIVLEV